MKRRLPSPAMIVAMLALFVALGGSVFAAAKAGHGGPRINGKKVKARSLPGNRIVRSSIAGNRLRRDTVTGARINEETLGPVPVASTLSGVPASGFAAAGVGVGFHFAGGGIPVAATAQTTVGAINIPAGHFFALATLALRNQSIMGTSSISHCKLLGPGGGDESRLALGDPDTKLNAGSMTLSGGFSASGPTAITVTCALEGEQGSTVIDRINLTAIRLANLTG